MRRRRVGRFYVPSFPSTFLEIVSIFLFGKEEKEMDTAMSMRIREIQESDGILKKSLDHENLLSAPRSKRNAPHLFSTHFRSLS